MTRHLALAALLAAPLLTAGAAHAQDSGSRLFLTHCASCHGAHGEGDGPVAAALAVSVPNLRTLAQRNHGEFPAEAVTQYIDGRNSPAAHGDRTMPVWGEVFRESEGGGDKRAAAQIAALVAFIRSLQYP